MSMDRIDFRREQSKRGLTDEEIRAIEKFPSSKIQKVRRGVSGLPEMKWVRGDIREVKDDGTLFTREERKARSWREPRKHAKPLAHNERRKEKAYLQRQETAERIKSAIEEGARTSAEIEAATGFCRDTIHRKAKEFGISIARPPTAQDRLVAALSREWISTRAIADAMGIERDYAGKALKQALAQGKCIRRGYVDPRGGAGWEWRAS